MSDTKNSGYAKSSSADARAQRVVNPEKRSVGELFSSATAQFSTLVRDEIEFTQKSWKQKFLNLGMGGVFLAVAGVLALFMFGFILHAMAAGFAMLFGGNWLLGYLCVVVFLAIAITILTLVGIKKLKKSGTYKTDIVGGMSKNVDAVKKGLSK